MAEQKTGGHKQIAQNRKAYHDYFVDDRYEAGIALTGTEIKSVRSGARMLTRVAPKSDTDAQKPFELRRMYRVASLPQGSFPKGICVILMLIPLICKMIVLFVSYRAFQSA